MSVYSDSYRQSEGPSQGPFQQHPHARCGGGNWNPIELVAMVLGFIIFWPIGLAILFAKMWQRKHSYQGDIPSFLEAKIREKWGQHWQANWSPKWQAKWEAKMGRWACYNPGNHHWDFRPRSSGNVAFDDWRESELARLEEERQKLLAAEREFVDFMENLRRAKDREEFDRFMAARNQGGPGTPPPHPTA